MDIKQFLNSIGKEFDDESNEFAKVWSAEDGTKEDVVVPKVS